MFRIQTEALGEYKGGAFILAATSLEETQRTKHHNKISIRMVGDGSKKWGASNHCPACDRTVYPSEQVVNSSIINYYYF